MLGFSSLRLNLRLLQGVPLPESVSVDFLKIALYNSESFELSMSIEESFSISGVSVNQ